MPAFQRCCRLFRRKETYLAMEYSEETLKQFDSMSSRDVVQAMMNLPIQQQAEAAPDLSDAQVNQIKNVVGGEQQYGTLMEWASSSLPPSSVEVSNSWTLVQVCISLCQVHWAQSSKLSASAYQVCASIYVATYLVQQLSSPVIHVTVGFDE